MFDDDILGWDDALDDLADELVMRVGNQQIAIREEELGGVFGSLGKMLNPVTHLKNIASGVSSLARGDIKGALDPAGFIFKKKRRRRRRRPSSRSRSSTRSRSRSRSRSKSSTRSRPRSRSRSGWGGSIGGGGGVNPALMAMMAARQAPAVSGGVAPHQMLEMLRLMSRQKTRHTSRKVRTKGTIEPHLDRLARKIEANLDPKLKGINRLLGRAGVQRSATSEHNAITKRSAYRRRVLKMLAKIMQQCPDGHPLREESVRVLGNVLGNAGMVITRPRS